MEKMDSGNSKKIGKVNNLWIECAVWQEKRLKMSFFVLPDSCFEMFDFISKWGKI